MAVCYPVGRLEGGPSACQCFDLATVPSLAGLPITADRSMILAEPRTDYWTGVTRMNDGIGTPGEPEYGPPVDGEEPVLVRPVAHLRSPIFDEPAPLPPSRGGERILARHLVRAIGPYLVSVVAIGLPILAVAGGDWLWVIAGLTVAAIALHELAQRVTFTFAEGFLAFRNRDEWPHGVQEEYDIRYSWPATGNAPPGR
jgi:hypothetical protein